MLASLAAGARGGSADRRASIPTPEATPTAAEPPSPAVTPRPVPRSLDAVLRRLEGREIGVEGRTVRLDRTTLTCAGVGRNSWRHARRAWPRFSCAQPTFPPCSVAGPGAIFFVEPTRRTLVLVDASFTTY